MVCNSEVIELSCGFPGRRRNVFAALRRVRRKVQAEERVYDCLQEGRVARGVMFGVVLQGLRGITQ